MKKVDNQKRIINSLEEIRKIGQDAKETINSDESYVLPNLDSISNTSEEFKKSLLNMNSNEQFNIVLGKTDNKFIYESLLNFPNILISGTINTGKTSFIHSIICLLLMKNSPKDLKLIMCASKAMEFSIYNGIPHLLTPVVTDPGKASIALKKAVSEMERRYELFEENKTKNITSYNKLIEDKNSKLSDDEKLKKLPYVVVVIDELTNFTKDSEITMDSLEEISRIGYIVGVHLVTVANYPSSKVISPIAKNNFPARVAFRTTSENNSRMILDQPGAEKLSGAGNIIFTTITNSKHKKIKTILIDEKDINNIISHTIEQQKAQYDDNFLKLEAVDQDLKNEFELEADYDDPLYNEIVEFVVIRGQASASLLQRKYKLGYNRAAQIIDLLEERGIIGPQKESKPREALVKFND